MKTNNPSLPQKVNFLRGKVVQGDYGKGSKSEHQAVFLETGQERYLLRRKTGPAIGDEELKQFVGHHVECDGFLVATTLLAESIKIVS
jgi:hypothetical protein